MNIFVLDENVQKCAQMHCDKHVVKMILELAQLLSTAHRVLDGKEFIVPQNGRNYKRWLLSDHREQILYKSTHVNHPCGVWLRESCENYHWTHNLLGELLKEYEHRYKKIHAVCHKGIFDELVHLPKNIPIKSKTPYAQAMPEDYRSDDVVDAYRTYYLCEKAHLLQYTEREHPTWIKEFA